MIRITMAIVAAFLFGAAMPAIAEETNSEVKEAGMLSAYVGHCKPDADRAEFLMWFIGAINHEHGSERVEAEIVRVMTRIKEQADKEPMFIPFFCNQMRPSVDRAYDRSGRRNYRVSEVRIRGGGVAFIRVAATRSREGGRSLRQEARGATRSDGSNSRLSAVCIDC